MEEKKTDSKKWWLKWVITLGVIILLVAGVRLALKSDWVFDKITTIAVGQVNDQINGSVDIQSIRGDLLSEITIAGVTLKDLNNEDVISIDTIEIKYKVLDLIRAPYKIEEFSIKGLDAFVIQEDDSVWNVMKLIDLEDEPVEDSDPIFWSIEQLNLDRANVNIKSEILLPDGELTVRGLKADMLAGAGQNGFYGTLKSLEFALNEARLPEPIDVFLAGGAEGERYTLESLVINSGRTLLKADALYTENEEVETGVEMAPLSWKDLAAYVEDLPLQQDISMKLGVSGRLSDLNVTVHVESPGLEKFIAEAGLRLDEKFELNRLNLSIENLNTPLLTGIENSPTLNRFTFSGIGNLNFEQPEVSDWSGDLSLSGLHFEEYALDSFESSYSLIQNDFEFSGRFAHQDETVNLRAFALGIWSDKTQLDATLEARNLNLATWLNDPDLDSNLNINSGLNGSGFDPENFSLHSELRIYDSRLGDQAFSELAFVGDVDPNQIKGLLNARLTESELSAVFDLSGWQADPSYTFEATLKSFNTAELTGLEEFPTRLNGTLKGEGSSFDLEQLTLTASAAFDSSFVNREEIQTLRAEFRIENSFLFIDEALLESPIVDAEFSVRQSIIDLTNADNQLSFSAVLKDLQPLTPLFGLDLLESEGTVLGNLARGESGFLQFDGSFDLEEVQVDTLFHSERIIGSLTAILFDEPEVEVNIELIEPFINDLGVQDVTIMTKATLGESETFGRVGFTIINDEESSLSHEGDFRVDSTKIWLRSDLLNFTTDLRTLSLIEPFDITYENETLRVDTLRIQSPAENAYLTFWAPHVDSLKQHVGLDARNLNLGSLQTTIIEEALFEGLLSGSVELLNDTDNLEIKATGLLSEFYFEDGSMDSVRFDLGIKDEWFEGYLGGWHAGSDLFAGNIKVPFIPGDPLTFDDQFFDQDVEGEFRLFETDLEYWFSFIPGEEPEETSGKISFYAVLGGLAGNPELEGKMVLREARLSGVQIDSIGVDLNYIHENENVEFEGKVIAQQQPIVDFDARLPFKVDLRQAEVLLPGDDDSVMVNLNTNNFDIALFNDFVDRDVIRQISGRLNGSLSLRGRIADLQPSGRMELTNGSMRIVPAGITLNEIGSIINFESDRVQLQQFSMRSGPGRIRASGFVEIENLSPGNVELDIRGNQFRAANTSEYNATIDLNADLRGTIDEPRITGNLTFLNGFVNLQNFGERAVEDVQLEDEEEPEPFEFYDALAIEMNVNFARQFFIRNRQFLDMEIELGGNVDLVKESYEDLQMFGALEGVRGFARPLGKNFVLDEATISFFGPIENPEMNVITRYEPPQAQSDVRIFYIIEGTVEDPQFRFDSEPQLELQDIISYTLFGKPFYELESWEQVMAGTGSSPTAADFAIDVLLDRVEMLASQRLGIDVVQIDNSRSGSNSTTSIKTGWYLNRRTFFAILNEISSTRPKTLFMLEYLLMDNLELIITQGDDSREGIDLRWKYDY
jgi:hypothetical protein